MLIAQITDLHIDSGGGESGAANVIVTLLDGSGGVVNNPLTGQPYTATTNATGLYTFTNLISGTYRVRIDAANFQSGGPLAGYLSSVPTQADPNSDTDSDDNGIDDVLYLTNGIQSGVITLTLGTEPTGEAEESGYLSDNNSNLTIDFGFYHLLQFVLPLGTDHVADGLKMGLVGLLVQFNHVAVGNHFAILSILKRVFGGQHGLL